MREAWTDERLDDMNRRMESGFNRVDADIRNLRTEMNARFERVESRFDDINRRFDDINRRFDDINRTINRTMLRLGGGAIVTMIVGFAGIIAT